MPYYIGVYEVTASQYALIMGGSGTDTKPVEKTWREIRGCDVAQTSTYNGTQAPSVSYSGVGLKWTQNEELMSSWPNSDQVDSGSFIGVLRSKVSIKCDLPTEAQWEMACKAGSITPLYIGDTNSAENAALISGEPVLDPSGSRLIYVGNYMPNALGLYDMTGNVSEWCLDVYAADLGSGVAKNPKGPAESFESFKLLNGKFIDMYDLSVKGTIICGGASAKIPGCYYDLTYVAKGIRRVVKGANARTATRNTELNICYDNPKFRMDYTDYYEKSCTRYEAVNDYDNKKHGIRLMVVADE